MHIHAQANALTRMHRVPPQVYTKGFPYWHVAGRSHHFPQAKTHKHDPTPSAEEGFAHGTDLLIVRSIFAQVSLVHVGQSLQGAKQFDCPASDPESAFLSCFRTAHLFRAAVT